MTLLDRFRAQSRDKHADPSVRLAFVGEIPLSEREAIAAIAREDEDARVRKAAVAKLMDPAALASITHVGVARVTEPFAGGSHSTTSPAKWPPP